MKQCFYLHIFLWLWCSELTILLFSMAFGPVQGSVYPCFREADCACDQTVDASVFSCIDPAVYLPHGRVWAMFLFTCSNYLFNSGHKRTRSEHHDNRTQSRHKPDRAAANIDIRLDL